MTKTGSERLEKKMFASELMLEIKNSQNKIHRCRGRSHTQLSCRDHRPAPAARMHVFCRSFCHGCFYSLKQGEVTWLYKVQFEQSSEQQTCSLELMLKEGYRLHR
uniref:Uncharacterized protein n=1 Tax=Nothobranchius kadleci TaxID=1051664 RepID=A0A1A8D2B2_NOTKA